MAATWLQVSRTGRFMSGRRSPDENSKFFGDRNLGWCPWLIRSDGLRLAAWGEDGTIKIWDANTGRLDR